ncbi:MAG: hypothetical protein HY738_11650 [Bacteroidia bacterium]|nr:hypothetical protein [Bacteroidia bacterium]
MAKTKMVCPFSRKFCKECPLFIGRHYYLCDKTKIDNEGGKQKTGMRGEQGFEMPVHLTQSPGWLTANKVTERTFDTH